MGWTFTYMTPAKLIADEVGAGPGGTNKILDKARGVTFAGETENWLLVETADGTLTIVMALSRTSRKDGATYSGVKIVTESMGPSSSDVPEKVLGWFDRVEAPNEWAEAFRRSARASHAVWRVKVADLTDADVGKTFGLKGFTAKYPSVTFLGWSAGRNPKPAGIDAGRVLAQAAVNHHHRPGAERVPLEAARGRGRAFGQKVDLVVDREDPGLAQLGFPPWSTRLDASPGTPRARPTP